MEYGNNKYAKSGVGDLINDLVLLLLFRLPSKSEKSRKLPAELYCTAFSKLIIGIFIQSSIKLFIETILFAMLQILLKILNLFVVKTK